MYIKNMALLSVKNLTIRFHTRNGIIKAVENISFSVNRGETLAIVGESGSGKSVACYGLLGLVPMPPGKIESGAAYFNDIDLIQAKEQDLQKIRGNDIAVIFQDPMTSLNPYLTIGEQLTEPLTTHKGKSRSEAVIMAIKMLCEVGIKDPEQKIYSYPHEFSGGMQQRVMIAMALMAKPKLLICDEPTTALDVTTQAQILILIKELQKKYGIAVIFISHDLGVVAGIADKVAVMKEGLIVEEGNTEDIFYNAKNAYTQKLLSSIPCGEKQLALCDENMIFLRVNNLKVFFHKSNSYSPWSFANMFSGKDKKIKVIKAVNDISFEIRRGEILGLVGESGSGKSTLGRAILQLTPIASGNVVFDDMDLTLLLPSKKTSVRKRMQMIFQDPYSSLNPRMSVYDTLAEPLLYHRLVSRKDAAKEVLRLMDDVGLARSAARKYPHEFSGGQRQRIAIGRAISTKPEFIVADEPVSALDVTVQAQILELILFLVDRHNLTMMFISHDLSVVRYIADRIAVMRHGKLVEMESTADIFKTPSQEYTKQLIAAVPLADPIKEKERQIIAGDKLKLMTRESI